MISTTAAQQGQRRALRRTPRRQQASTRLPAGSQPGHPPTLSCAGLATIRGSVMGPELDLVFSAPELSGLHGPPRVRALADVEAMVMLLRAEAQDWVAILAPPAPQRRPRSNASRIWTRAELMGADLGQIATRRRGESTRDPQECGPAVPPWPRSNAATALESVPTFRRRGSQICDLAGHLVPQASGSKRSEKAQR